MPSYTQSYTFIHHYTRLCTISVTNFHMYNAGIDGFMIFQASNMYATVFKSSNEIRFEFAINGTSYVRIQFDLVTRIM